MTKLVDKLDVRRGDWSLSTATDFETDGRPMLYQPIYGIMKKLYIYLWWSNKMDGKWMNNNQNVAETCFLPGFLSWFEAHPVLLSVLWSVSATLIQQSCMRTQNVILSGVDRPQRSSNSPSVLELFLGLKKKLTRCRSCPYARIRSSHAAGVVLKLEKKLFSL